MLHDEGTIGNISALTETPEFAEFMADVTRNEAAITEEELIEMERIARQLILPTNETRVSIAGRRYRAEARVAGGQWVKAGTYRDENDAQRAASAKVRDLAGVRS